jgi:predicted MFS family arabinose efflux permease
MSTNTPTASVPVAHERDIRADREIRSDAGTASAPSAGTAQTPAAAQTPARTAWGGVLVMMATSFVLVAAEFLPPSLLPAMAASLGVSEGQAGQTVTVTALAGLVAAPVIGLLFPRLDRRTLLMVLALAATVSNVAVAISSNLVLLLVARLLLGAALGGFWAMSLAVAARLSTPNRFGRAVMLINTGTTMATVAGVPLGIWLGSITDWRVVFAAMAVVTVIVAIGLRLALPAVPAGSGTGLRALGQTLATRGIAWALTGHVLTVMANFLAFTYIRAAFARLPELDAAAVALLLAVFGVGGVAGNFGIGLLVDKHLRWLRFAVPLLLSASIGVVALAPASTVLLGLVVGLWGFAFGAWLPVITTWLARVVPERMESGGGLLVAGFQLAIMLGAAVGGLIVDGVGVSVALTVATISALVGAVLFGTARTREPGTAD